MHNRRMNSTHDDVIFKLLENVVLVTLQLRLWFAQPFIISIQLSFHINFCGVELAVVNGPKKALLLLLLESCSFSVRLACINE
jgi:hypothetical protein